MSIMDILLSIVIIALSVAVMWLVVYSFIVAYPILKEDEKTAAKAEKLGFYK